MGGYSFYLYDQEVIGSKAIYKVLPTVLLLCRLLASNYDEWARTDSECWARAQGTGSRRRAQARE